jgi:hypothetical protein
MAISDAVLDFVGMVFFRIIDKALLWVYYIIE